MVAITVEANSKTENNKVMMDECGLKMSTLFSIIQKGNNNDKI